VRKEHRFDPSPAYRHLTSAAKQLIVREMVDVKRAVHDFSIPPPEDTAFATPSTARSPTTSTSDDVFVPRHAKTAHARLYRIQRAIASRSGKYTFADDCLGLPLSS
jgi:hypothetical protein